jgi:hypothetical protein
MRAITIIQFRFQFGIEWIIADESKEPVQGR